MNKAYGYERWKSMGRQVKKGEKAIRIIAPAQVKEKRQQKNWMRKTTAIRSCSSSEITFLKRRKDMPLFLPG